MRVKRMRLVSFGPIEDTGWIEFEKGMNLIVGQNNSGKSALLKSFRLNLESWLHRNLHRYETHDLVPSMQEIWVEATGPEVRRAFLQQGGQLIWPLEKNDLPTEEWVNAEIFGSEVSHVLRMRRRPGSYETLIPDRPVHAGFDAPPNFAVQLSANPPSFTINGLVQGDNGLQIAQYLWARNIFCFDAERLNIGRCAQQDTDELTANASNLPAVLQRMQGRRPRLFEQLVHNVRRIVPTLHAVTPVPVGTNEVEMLIWPTSAMDRVEHGFSLNESGTGVAQVLAILTAVMTRQSSVIVIDEINSFLHPAAAKELLRVLSEDHSDHQFIVSTHSPDVIGSSDPSTVYLVKRDGFDSRVISVDLKNIEQLREMSDHLGISISDVFAADYVLWVEGRTEELCFDFLIRRWTLDVPTGLVLSPVISTSELTVAKRDLERMYDIYERLARVTLPLVKSSTFAFDAEGLSQQDRDDIVRRSKGRLLFLPRRQLECYFLSPSAIATFVTEQDGEACDEAAVRDAMIACASTKPFDVGAIWTGSLSDPEWQRQVDAAKLIDRVCRSVSEERVTYKKGDHGLCILKAALNGDRETMDELRSYLVSVLAKVTS